LPELVLLNQQLERGELILQTSLALPVGFQHGDHVQELPPALGVILGSLPVCRLSSAPFVLQIGRFR
jgi:hypothetical protein